MNKEKAEKYYDAGVWSIERLRKLVERGYLSEGEYEEITGEKY